MENFIFRTQIPKSFFQVFFSRLLRDGRGGGSKRGERKREREREGEREGERELGQEKN